MLKAQEHKIQRRRWWCSYAKLKGKARPSYIFAQ